jgi:hypothetical protein
VKELRSIDKSIACVVVYVVGSARAYSFLGVLISLTWFLNCGNLKGHDILEQDSRKLEEIVCLYS